MYFLSHPDDLPCVRASRHADDDVVRGVVGVVVLADQLDGGGGPEGLGAAAGVDRVAAVARRVREPNGFNNGNKKM